MANEQVFLELTVILFLAVASHFVIKRFRQPTIIGEIAIGVVLGPSIMGFVLNGFAPVDPTCATGVPGPGVTCPPAFDPALIELFAALGSIFLLFLVGLETDVKAIFVRRNVYVAVGGVVLPWIGGFLTAYLMVAEDLVMATFVGAILVATSTAIASAVLLELGMMRTEVAATIMGAVIVDDILGLLVLSLAVGVAGGSIGVVDILIKVVIAVAFIVAATWIGSRYFGRFVTWAHAKGLKYGLTHTGFMVAMALAFFTAFLSEAIGLSAVVGAFLAGAMVSSNALRRDFHEGVTFLGSIFTPVFFISLGLLVDIWTLTAGLLLFGVVLLVVAFVTKLAGCGLAAKWTGMSREASLAVGYGMVPRGEVGLIIALVAVQFAVIGADLFSIIVVVMVVVSVIPAPLLRKYLLEMQKREAKAKGPERAVPEQGPF